MGKFQAGFVLNYQNLLLMTGISALLTGCSGNASRWSDSVNAQPRQVGSDAVAFTIGTGAGRQNQANTGADVPGDLLLDPSEEKAIGLAVEKVLVRPMVKKMEFSSTVEAPADRSGVVTSLVHGVVTKVLADLGQSVKAGQTLAYISSPDISEAQSNYLNAVAKVQEARAELQQLKTRVELVAAELERAKLLNKEGIAALKEVQLAQSKQASIISELAAASAVQTAALSYQASAKAKLQSLGLSPEALSDKTISYALPLKSPITGVIVQRAVSPGQSVGLSLSGISSTDPHNNLFTIADLSKVWVMLEVPQSEVSALKLGTPVIFRTEVAPNQVFHGRVTRLGENFDATSRTVGVRTEIPNPALTLKPGMLILATVNLDNPGRKVLTVPSRALQEVKNLDVVFSKLAAHRYQMRSVKLGEQSQDFSEVISGVKPGEEVVTEGSFFLKSEVVKASTGTGQ
jgi:cobalt-zinc-cadmium efflux system membrane fusion protein